MLAASSSGKATPRDRATATASWTARSIRSRPRGGLPQRANRRSCQAAGRRHRGDEGELAPDLGRDVARDQGLDPGLPERRGDPLGPPGALARKFAHDDPLEGALPFDQPRPQPLGADRGEPAEDLIHRDAQRDQAIDHLDAVQEREDDRSPLGQGPDDRGDPGERVILDGDDGVLGPTQRVRVVGRLDGDVEGPFRGADLEATRSQGIKMAPARQQRDLVPRAGQDASVVAADAARSQDRKSH